MLTLLAIVLFVPSMNALLHHLAVGTTNGQALYSLEMDDESRKVYTIQARDAGGASPSLALDRSKQHLFSSRPQDGTLTRHSIAPTYELISEGTMEIPSSCNTTNFLSLKLGSSVHNTAIWGSASTGTCSIVFGVSPDGYDTINSQEIAGDVHSIAWAPNGRNLHALDSHSSGSLLASITNFRMSEDPNLQDVVGIDVLGNVTSASQIVAHPSETLTYIVTKDSNELIVVSLAGDTLVSNSTPVLRYRILPTSLDATQFQSSSLAISASRNTLWALSQSSLQAVITAFTLNVTTGEVVDVAARASWQGTGEGQLTAAPFDSGDVVAITDSPTAYITILGLDQSTLPSARIAENSGLHDYLNAMQVDERKRKDIQMAAPKIKSYGRVFVDDHVNLGDCAWID